MKISVFLADDNLLVREGVAALIGFDTDLEVIDPQGTVLASVSGPKPDVARQVFQIIQQQLIPA